MGLGSIFGGSSTDTEIIENYPGAGKFRKQVAGTVNPMALQRLSTAGQPYKGELVAPLSAYEQSSLGTLGDYLASTMPGNTNLSKLSSAELEKTLSGGYDPIQSEYWKAYQDEMNRQIQKQSDAINAKTSAADRFFGGGRIKETANMSEGVLNNAAIVLGQIAEQERMNRLNTAMGMPTYLGQNEALTQGRIQAGQQYGALPRQIQQAKDMADYQEFQRQLTDLGIPLDVALELMKPLGVVQTQEGGMDLSGLLSSGLMLAASGGLGGLSGSGASNALPTGGAFELANNNPLIQDWLSAGLY